MRHLKNIKIVTVLVSLLFILNLYSVSATSPLDVCQETLNRIGSINYLGTCLSDAGEITLKLKVYDWANEEYKPEKLFYSIEFQDGSVHSYEFNKELPEINNEKNYVLNEANFSNAKFFSFLFNASQGKTQVLCRGRKPSEIISNDKGTIYELKTCQEVQQEIKTQAENIENGTISVNIPQKSFFSRIADFFKRLFS